MPAIHNFHIRNAGTAEIDVQAVLGAMDSTLTYLAETGNGEQWGSIPFSQREGQHDSLVEELEASEHYRLTGEGEARRSFIAEVESNGNAGDDLRRRLDDQGRSWLPVGSVDFLENSATSYISEQLGKHVDAAREAGGFACIEMMTADFRVRSMSKGVGAALVNEVKRYASEKGMKAIYVDCWLGGTGKLVKYGSP